MKKIDALLIGSGISSLTVALLLARRGLRVRVLEQHAKPGGYMHCFQRFGERFDTGAHYVGAMDPGHPFHTLLTYLGVYQDEMFLPLDPNGFDVFHFPEFTARIKKGYEETIRGFTELFPLEAEGIRRYFAMVQGAVRFFPTYQFDDLNVEIPVGPIFETSLAAVVEGLTENPQLRCLLYAYCTLHGVMPKDVPFGFHAVVTDSLIRSPYGLSRGGDSLAASFVRQIENHGGEVLVKKRVQNLHVSERNVQAVETEDGARYEADWVISGLHPKATYALCTDKTAFSEIFAQRLRLMRESAGMVGVSAMTTGDLSPLRNYYFFDSSDPERFLRVGESHEEPSAVFLAPSRREIIAGQPLPINLHSAGPLGWFEPWRTSTYAKRPDEYKDLKLRIAENNFRFVERYQPGFRSTIQKFTTSTPLSNMHFNGSPDGTAYGLYHSIQNTGPRSIGPRTKVLNLLLTGQNCLFPGLLGAAISGLRTAGHVVGIKPILAELKALGIRA